MWLTFAAAIAGIISTLLAWCLSPQRKKDNLCKQLVGIYKQLEDLERKRDEALHKNDNDTLTIVTADIIRLRDTKADLLQQLGQN